MSGLVDLPTPALILDEQVMLRNVAGMAARIGALGCVLRPHVKTHKSAEIARIVAQAGQTRGVTVSTLEEAEYFFAAGEQDILYAVGLSPQKVARAADLIRRGCELKVITDNIAMAGLVASAAEREGVCLPVLIELDVDGHRSGIDPDGAGLIDLATAIVERPHLSLAGVMTHAGGSYGARTPAELALHAAREVDSTRGAAGRLRAAGLECPVVSIGSTPTASSYTELDGITEVRAGVYVFFDLVQAGIGIATREDIALSVLTTVIGHQPSKGWIITDAGWMAMSRDRGTAAQSVDFGYGQVCDVEGREIDGLIVQSVNQEHGVIGAARADHAADLASFPVGTRLRIKPNHACATAGQFHQYFVLDHGVIRSRERLHGH